MGWWRKADWLKSTLPSPGTNYITSHCRVTVAVDTGLTALLLGSLRLLLDYRLGVYLLTPVC